MDKNNVIYQSHLQIVEDRELHETMKEILLGEFPTAIIVAPSVLQSFHGQLYQRYLYTIMINNPNRVWYYLPAGTYGAIKDHHCNGIRYGTELSDYMSLPQIKLPKQLSIGE